ncbi:MAG TPA: hypothetical protein DCX34_03480, partial [Roseovarius sp.]|nr:hypothetical protein [Roseovarius sp.]
AQTVTGRPLDYPGPVVEPIHLYTEIAHGLSIISRFAGATDMAYSVAQHSVQMAEAAEHETGDRELAAFCLLHDAHETPFGDIPSPTKMAIADEITASIIRAGGTEAAGQHAAGYFKRAIKTITGRQDRAIVEAAGLDYARFVARAREITEYDLRALFTEREHLLRRPPRPWAIDDRRWKPLPLKRGPIRPWPAAAAYERFVGALDRLCPIGAAAAGRESALQNEGLPA